MNNFPVLILALSAGLPSPPSGMMITEQRDYYGSLSGPDFLAAEPVTTVIAAKKANQSGFGRGGRDNNWPSWESQPDKRQM